MANTIAQKLKIKEGFILRTLNAPPNFEQALGVLPASVMLMPGAKKYNQLHWFVLNKAVLEKQLPEVLKLVTGEVVCWIYYPKRSSKMQTDLTRDKGWETLLTHDELQWISLISFDETWSAFGFRLKTVIDIKKATEPQERIIFEYTDAKTKTVRLPEDFAAALQQNKKVQQVFDALSFTNKKEYLEWILTAKREETRVQRVKGSIERLGKGWKNPANI